MPENADPMSALTPDLVWKAADHAIRQIEGGMPSNARRLLIDLRTAADEARAALAPETGHPCPIDGQIGHTVSGNCGHSWNLRAPSLEGARHPEAPTVHDAGCRGLSRHRGPCVTIAPSLEGARHPEAGETPILRDTEYEPPTMKDRTRARLHRP